MCVLTKRKFVKNNDSIKKILEELDKPIDSGRVERMRKYFKWYTSPTKEIVKDIVLTFNSVQDDKRI